MRQRTRAGTLPVEASLIVNDTPQACYWFWRDLTNLPRFMRHLKSVDVLDDRRSRWNRTAPAFGTCAPGGRGTIVRVQLHYTPLGGELGATVAALFGESPQQQVREDLRRFKQYVEAGEVATIDGQPAGRRDAVSRLLSRAAP